MKTTPLGNNCLIEVTREYADVSRTDENESMSYGKLVDFHMSPYHLTASAALQFDDDYITNIMSQELEGMKGKTVRWEEFAEGGQTFKEGGKTYALVPWWRLIGVSDGE